jgi:N-acetylglucosamine-6-phosphate deacetylase
LQDTVLVNGRVYMPDGGTENCPIHIRDGRVTGLTRDIPGDATILDMSGWNIAAGLIDIQINGGEAYYFSEAVSAAGNTVPLIIFPV